MSLENYQQSLLGGVAVRLASEDQPTGEVVVRAGLEANARDQLLVWAERTLDDLAPDTGPSDLQMRAWTATASGGWQQLLYSTETPPSAS